MLKYILKKSSVRLILALLAVFAIMFILDPTGIFIKVPNIKIDEKTTIILHNRLCQQMGCFGLCTKFENEDEMITKKLIELLKTAVRYDKTEGYFLSSGHVKEYIHIKNPDSEHLILLNALSNEKLGEIVVISTDITKEQIRNKAIYEIYYVNEAAHKELKSIVNDAVPSDKEILLKGKLIYDKAYGRLYTALPSFEGIGDFFKNYTEEENKDKILAALDTLQYKSEISEGDTKRIARKSYKLESHDSVYFIDIFTAIHVSVQKYIKDETGEFQRRWWYMLESSRPQELREILKETPRN